jgi:hypothetical protein
MIKANNPNLKSWVDVLPGSDFPIQNLPFGVFETTFGEKRVCSAIGEYVIDLVELDYHGFLDGLMHRQVRFLIAITSMILWLREKRKQANSEIGCLKYCRMFQVNGMENPRQISSLSI